MSESVSESGPAHAAVRIDRWLWAARFFKTRSLAKQAVEGGKVHIEGHRAKPAKEIRIGRELTIRRGDSEMTVVVTELSEQRGPAKVAQLLYRETEHSIEHRETAAARRRMERAGLQVPSRKPTKKDRRDLHKFKSRGQDMDAGERS